MNMKSSHSQRQMITTEGDTNPCSEVRTRNIVIPTSVGWKTKNYHTVRTFPKSNRKTKKYHTVGTIPISSGKTNKYHTVGTVLKSNRKTKKYHTVRTVPKSNRKTKKYHTVRTVLKSNRKTNKNTTLSEQFQNPIEKQTKIPHCRNSSKIQ